MFEGSKFRKLQFLEFILKLWSSNSVLLSIATLELPSQDFHFISKKILPKTPLTSLFSTLKLISIQTQRFAIRRIDSSSNQHQLTVNLPPARFLCSARWWLIDSNLSHGHNVAMTFNYHFHRYASWCLREKEVCESFVCIFDFCVEVQSKLSSKIRGESCLRSQ
jgi:hypothetical protein